LVPDQTRSDPNVLIEYCAKQQVTHCFLPTALLEASINQLNTQKDLSLEYIFAGGEKLSAIAINNTNVKVINHYGPAEATVIASSYQLDPNSTSVPAIGKAIDNVFLLVLSKDMKLLPFGAIGELYIGGAGLARGYINNPDLTSGQFIGNPFSKDLKQSIYKTGDLVRYLKDGNLEFIGRVDDQVKIRGFRIELSEITHQLSLLDIVNTCEVIVLKLKGNKRIVAYITHLSSMNEEDVIAEIQTQLTLLLPDYMLPSQYVILQALPLTPNGKVDHKALPDLAAIITKTIAYIAPEGEIELSLSRIWSGLLNLPITSISAQANFFRLGGDSLLAIKLMTKIKDEFHIHLDIHAIFESKTLSILAAHLAMFSTVTSSDTTEETECFEI
jgi:acyl-coenzyme A synthetase/AMP-(fatty) acid ligase/acyl carrier protein